MFWFDKPYARNIMHSYTKRGPGRRHKQGKGRLMTALKYPGTHRMRKES